jgi:hypothetical protein
MTSVSLTNQLRALKHRFNRAPVVLASHWFENRVPERE